jgi:hypothetical protein
MSNVLLADGLVHSRVTAGLALCGEAVPKWRHGTDDELTCDACAELENAITEPHIVEVDVVCSCGERATWRLNGDAPARATLASLVCQRCGEVGRCELARRPPPEEARELPPHPEEP